MPQINANGMELLLFHAICIYLLVWTHFVMLFPILLGQKNL